MTNATATPTTADPTELARSLTGEWDLDAAHSSIGFVARYLMFSKVRGSFTRASGRATITGDPTTSTVAVSIDAGSIETGNGQRDGHLRSADFLDVERYPAIEFRATGFQPGAHPRHRVNGELTMHGVTRPVSLEVEYLGAARDPYGRDKVAFTVSASIDREEWGLTWNQALETGGVLVGKTIDVEIDGQLVRAS